MYLAIGSLISLASAVLMERCVCMSHYDDFRKGWEVKELSLLLKDCKRAETSWWFGQWGTGVRPGLEFCHCCMMLRTLSNKTFPHT